MLVNRSGYQRKLTFCLDSTENTIYTIHLLQNFSGKWNIVGQWPIEFLWITKLVGQRRASLIRIERNISHTITAGSGRTSNSRIRMIFWIVPGTF